MMYSEEFVKTLQKERDEYFNQRNEARYQIARAIVQLEAATGITFFGHTGEESIVIDSVIAQLRAYEESVK
jgi:hypothetical protein